MGPAPGSPQDGIPAGQPGDDSRPAVGSIELATASADTRENASNRQIGESHASAPSPGTGKAP